MGRRPWALYAGAWLLALWVGAGCGGDADGRDDDGDTSTSISGGGSGGSGSGSGAQGGGAPGGAGGGTGLPGQSCDDPHPIGQPLPAGSYHGSGSFPGSCSAGSASLWLAVEPPISGCYRLKSDALAPAFTTHALFEGLSCEPLGRELGCRLASQPSRDLDRFLEAGVGYLLVLEGSLVNPSASMSLWSTDPGHGCPLPRDVSGDTFPLTINDTFRCEPLAAGSCATTPFNALWLAYTATSSSTHTITVTNTCSSCDSNLAVFEGDGCAPLGPELACEAVSGPSASASVALLQGTRYLIAYSTNDSGQAPVDPEITILP